MTSQSLAPYQLRPYQQELLQAIYRAWHQGQRRVMAQLPTGGGKTLLFAEIARDLALRGEKILILAHREELVTQAADKVSLVAQSPVGIIKARYRPHYDRLIQVASVASLLKRLKHLEKEKVGLVIIDEAHHSTAATYRALLELFPQAYQLGVSATPIRLDGTGFEDLFDALVCGPSVGQLIQLKYLSPFRLYADPNPMSTKGVRTVQGDYSLKGLASANNIVELSGNLLSSYQQYAQGKRCLVFALNVEHSVAISQRYNEAGIPAAHLDGKTPDSERRQVLEQFRRGEILVLSNCALFDEGLDVPALEAVQVAKPTKSLTRWLQMVGRALRPMEGKKAAILLDHTKNWAIHGLPTRSRVWSLQGVEQDETVQVQRHPTGEVSERSLVIETPKQLTAIEETDEVQWHRTWAELIQQQQQKGYKPGWIYYRLLELQPPLSIWQQYARWRGYQPQWAEHQFNKQQPLAPAQSPPALSQDELDSLWQSVVKRFERQSPLMGSMLRLHSRLLSWQLGQAEIGFRHEVFWRFLLSRRLELEAAWLEVIQAPVHFTLRVVTFDEPV